MRLKQCEIKLKLKNENIIRDKHLNLNLCCYLEWDLFGIETSHYQMSPVFMPSDGQRLERIKVKVFKI